ncbi:hypothetical protein LEMLEM_LOCUS10243 [Lemmus lemmus]
MAKAEEHRSEQCTRTFLKLRYCQACPCIICQGHS